MIYMGATEMFKNYILSNFTEKLNVLKKSTNVSIVVIFFHDLFVLYILIIHMYIYKTFFFYLVTTVNNI